MATLTQNQPFHFPLFGLLRQEFFQSTNLNLHHTMRRRKPEDLAITFLRIFDIPSLKIIIAE